MLESMAATTCELPSSWVHTLMDREAAWIGSLLQKHLPNPTLKIPHDTPRVDLRQGPRHRHTHYRFLDPRSDKKRQILHRINNKG